MSVLQILLIFPFFAVFCQDPTINLPQGRVLGIKVFPKNAVTPIEIFYGIPYAAPPIGDKRFAAPQRHPGWKRTLYAHRMPPQCPNLGDDKHDTSEDCLYLNIWTPRRADNKSKMPVLVILYSESWSRGPVTKLPCDELAVDGIVVVTVAYRLSVMAFFTLNNIAARGNLALLDQYLALLWVQENIESFGGDATSITLMGHSGGADSILYHIASSRPIGLFQRAIIMSPRNFWRSVDDSRGTQSNEIESRQLVRRLGCTASNDKDTLTCLRTKTVGDIMGIKENLSWSDDIHPVPENYLPESEQYFSKPLSEVFGQTNSEKQQLDILLGYANLEVIDFADAMQYELLRHNASYLVDYATKKVIPELLRSLQITEVSPVLIEAIMWEFFEMSLQSRDNIKKWNAIESIGRMKSSVEWGIGSALLAARLARRVSRLYVYQYSQPGVDLLGTLNNFTGAVHGSDLVALLGESMLLQVSRRLPHLEEQRISSLMRSYITSFVKFGSPALESAWPRYRVGDAYIHDIKLETGHCGKSVTPRYTNKFWLQYVPYLTQLLTKSDYPESLTYTAGDGRLRGGVFALCGIAVVLLLLLCACGLLLRRERLKRLNNEFNE